MKAQEYIPKFVHSSIHLHTRARTHTYAYTYTRAHTHTHGNILVHEQGRRGSHFESAYSEGAWRTPYRNGCRSHWSCRVSTVTKCIWKRVERFVYVCMCVACMHVCMHVIHAYMLCISAATHCIWKRVERFVYVCAWHAYMYACMCIIRRYMHTCYDWAQLYWLLLEESGNVHRTYYDVHFFVCVTFVYVCMYVMYIYMYKHTHTYTHTLYVHTPSLLCMRAFMNTFIFFVSNMLWCVCFILQVWCQRFKIFMNTYMFLISNMLWCSQAWDRRPAKCHLWWFIV